jgi:hypothetical protein
MSPKQWGKVLRRSAAIAEVQEAAAMVAKHTEENRVVVADLAERTVSLLLRR